jgi:hypothetical protein
MVYDTTYVPVTRNITRAIDDLIWLLETRQPLGLRLLPEKEIACRVGRFRYRIGVFGYGDSQECPSQV